MLLIVCSLIVYISLASVAMIKPQPASFQPHRVALGNRIRELRELQGLSQEQLAELAGVHRTYVSSVERGQRNVGIDNIYAFARALKVPPARLFEDSPSDTP